MGQAVEGYGISMEQSFLPQSCVIDAPFRIPYYPNSNTLTTLLLQTILLSEEAALFDLLRPKAKNVQFLGSRMELLIKVIWILSVDSAWIQKLNLLSANGLTLFWCSVGSKVE